MATAESSDHPNLKKIIPGVLLVLMGAALLTNSLGYLDHSFGHNLAQLWPAGVLALGTYLVLRRRFPLAAPVAGAGILAGTILVAVTLAATGTELPGARIHFDRFGGHVTGSGQMITVERSLLPFHRIQTDGSTAVEVTIGEPSSAMLTVDDNLVDVIRTHVTSRSSHVREVRQFPAGRGVHRVTMPHLDATEIHGSGHAVVRGLAGHRFESKIFGSGDVSLDGGVDAHHINIHWSGGGSDVAEGGER